MWSIFKRKEFYTAEQVHAEVIAQTLVMIESIKQDMQKLSLPEKAQAEKQLLASLGLHNTKNMQVIRDAEDKIVEHNNIIETNKRVLKIIEEMHTAFGKKAMYLPMNVFTQILDKYHCSHKRHNLNNQQQQKSLFSFRHNQKGKVRGCRNGKYHASALICRNREVFLHELLIL